MVSIYNEKICSIQQNVQIKCLKIFSSILVPWEWIQVRGSYYHFSQNRLKFSEAEASCKSNNAKLFEPKNAAINNDIAAKAKAKGLKHGPWIGIHDINDENNFVYASNNAIKISWTNWKNGEPNNSGGKEDCVQLSTTNGKWNDNNCLKKFNYICEKQ